jgi:hypothetical protein
MDPPAYTTQNIAQPSGAEEKSQTNVPLMNHPYGHAGYCAVYSAQPIYAQPEGPRPRVQRSRRRRICARVMHLLLLDAILLLVVMYNFKDLGSFVSAVS